MAETFSKFIFSPVIFLNSLANEPNHIGRITSLSGVDISVSAINSTELTYFLPDRFHICCILFLTGFLDLPPLMPLVCLSILVSINLPDNVSVGNSLLVSLLLTFFMKVGASADIIKALFSTPVENALGSDITANPMFDINSDANLDVPASTAL